MRKFAGSPEEVLFGGGEHDHDDNRPRGGDVMDDDDDGECSKADCSPSFSLCNLSCSCALTFHPPDGDLI